MPHDSEQHAWNTMRLWLKLSGMLQATALVALVIVVLSFHRGCCPERKDDADPTGPPVVAHPATGVPSATHTQIVKLDTKHSANSKSDTKPAKLTRWPFGGPYGFKESYQKVLDFEQCYRLGYAYSKATYITASNRDLFASSIKDNKRNPHGEYFQRYNYVIEKSEPDAQKQNWRIKVAVWRDVAEIEALGYNPPDFDDLDGKPFIYTPGRMIDFFPEEPGGEKRFKPDSPLWISAVSGTGLKDTGILDAMSKHFMLANVPDGGGVELFDRDTWLEKKVAYAGEILVDVEGDYYVVNNGSGTYRPDAPHLEAVARYFEEVLGVAPAYVQAPKPEPGEIRPFLTTASTKWTDITPLVPTPPGP